MKEKKFPTFINLTWESLDNDKPYLSVTTLADVDEDGTAIATYRLEGTGTVEIKKRIGKVKVPSAVSRVRRAAPRA